MKSMLSVPSSSFVAVCGGVLQCALQCVAGL